jgi:ParB family chromosome partitioning protein
MAKSLGKGLGKGLDALIPSLNVNEDDKVIEIPVDQLRANPYQPRKHFDDAALAELAESIKEHGVIQPIIVRSVLRGYEIIAGERRFRASQVAGKQTIPAVVRNFTDKQTMEVALIENVQREDLNAMEVAIAYQALIDQFDLTQEELSVKVGKSRSHIANFLRLLQLPTEIKDYVSRGTLSMGHARAIAGVEGEAVKKRLAIQAIDGQWSVRQLEEEIQTMSSPKKEKAAKVEKKDPQIRRIERFLEQQYMTTVKIKHNKNKGKIEFSYFSNEDLERLLEQLNINLE